MFQSFVPNHMYSYPIDGLTWNGFGWIIIVLVVWDIAWKGLAIWKAGRDNQSGWFIALFIINSLGILPILYLYVFSKKDKKKSN